MSLKLTEVAKARRRLAVERKQSKEAQGKVRSEPRTEVKPVFVSSRVLPAA